MNGQRKSDGPIVPMKSPNNAGQPAAEGAEGKGSAKGNLRQQNAPWTQSQNGAPSALERIRQAPPEATWRHYLRQEPDAGKPLVRIRGGGRGQPRSLLRPKALNEE